MKPVESRNFDRISTFEKSLEIYIYIKFLLMENQETRWKQIFSQNFLHLKNDIFLMKIQETKLFKKKKEKKEKKREREQSFNSS